MKLIINYDFIEAIKNAKEPFTAFKVIRNKKTRWATLNFPLYIAVIAAIQKEFDIPIILCGFGLGCCFNIFSESLENKIFSTDDYKEEAIQNLKKLSSQLTELNISTDYELLLDSKLYERKYKIQVNENKIPDLIESKYILVPTYTYNNEIKEESILQEHILGTNTYVLSLGSPSKQFKLCYSNT